MSDNGDGAAPSWPSWQPFTFGGLAVMAQSRYIYVFLAQLVTALLIGAIVVYFVDRSYAPVVLQEIQEMPDHARIVNGQLNGVDASIIAGSKFLAIAVTPETDAQIGQTADVQVQFRPSNARIGTVFRPDWGWEFPYVPHTMLDLSRKTAEPWFGAWKPVVLTVIGLAMFVELLVSWTALAILYLIPIKIIAWLSDRKLSWGGAWKLGSATLLPGALTMGVGILLYTWRGMDLLGLAFFLVAHFLIGWVYLIGGPLQCPKAEQITPKPNPFVP